MTRFEPARKDQAAISVGQTSDEPLTWTVTAAVTAGAVSGVLLAAATGTGRTVCIKVPSTATTGIYIDFGQAASSTDWFIEAGESIALSTEQEIRCIRAAGSDVTVHVMTGVVP